MMLQVSASKHTIQLSVLQQRRDILRAQLRRNIEIAKRLSIPSREAHCAWDEIDELTKSLHDLENRINSLTVLSVRDSSEYDDELARRLYDN